jgi:hypothetical protein
MKDEFGLTSQQSVLLVIVQFQFVPESMSKRTGLLTAPMVTVALIVPVPWQLLASTIPLVFVLASTAAIAAFSPVLEHA